MRAVSELRRRIFNGELRGGTRLTEVPLAEMLSISRTPVREALARLAQEGLLDRGSGGYIVRTFELSDVIDAIEFRGVIEGTAARLAAERGPRESDVERIRDVLDDIDACLGPASAEIDFQGYAVHNSRFHQILAGMPGSGLILREFQRVTRLPFAAPSAFLPDRAFFIVHRRSLDRAQEQHRAIVDAIVAREGQRAEHLAREHARVARDDLETLIRERGDIAGFSVTVE